MKATFVDSSAGKRGFRAGDRRTELDSAFMAAPSLRLGPTSPALSQDDARPYFLWWSECTVAELRSHLASPDAAERAYWLGALLREANTRDVWLFTNPSAIKDDWARLQRHLGRARPMWAWLLGIETPHGSAVSEP